MRSLFLALALSFFTFPAFSDIQSIPEELFLEGSGASKVVGSINFRVRVSLDKVKKKVIKYIGRVKYTYTDEFGDLKENEGTAFFEFIRSDVNTDWESFNFAFLTRGQGSWVEYGVSVSAYISGLPESSDFGKFINVTVKDFYIDHSATIPSATFFSQQPGVISFKEIL